jgi:hypothetical protein
MYQHKETPNIFHAQTVLFYDLRETLAYYYKNRVNWKWLASGLYPHHDKHSEISFNEYDCREL